MDIIWKDVPGLDNRFKANSNGNIWDKVENDWVPYYFMSIRGYYTKGSKKPSGFGYLAFSYKGKNYRVHRVIAETFIPNPNNLPCVNHLNENPSDNRVENLEWCSYKENSNWGTAIQRRVDNISKSIAIVDNDGRIIETFKNSIEAEKILRSRGVKVGFSNIRAVCTGKRKTAGGYRFIELPTS